MISEKINVGSSFGVLKNFLKILWKIAERIFGWIDGEVSGRISSVGNPGSILNKTTWMIPEAFTKGIWDGILEEKN